jgi:hypothetical protein
VLELSHALLPDFTNDLPPISSNYRHNISKENLRDNSNCSVHNLERTLLQDIQKSDETISFDLERNPTTIEMVKFFRCTRTTSLKDR